MCFTPSFISARTALHSFIDDRADILMGLLMTLDITQMAILLYIDALVFLSSSEICL